jgi:hypothetical protein
MTNGWVHASYKRKQVSTYKILLSFLLLFVPQAFVHMLLSTLCLLAINRFLWRHSENTPRRRRFYWLAAAESHTSLPCSATSSIGLIGSKSLRNTASIGVLKAFRGHTRRYHRTRRCRRSSKSWVLLLLRLPLSCAPRRHMSRAISSSISMPPGHINTRPLPFHHS